MKTLVAYFSAGGKTAAVAKKMAQMTGADLFEIRPEQPYTKEDLDWTDPQARCSLENADDRDVPYVGQIDDMDQYDLIFLGFPIWYDRAPNIVRTFCRAHDWTGKSVALFATSGGSGIEEAAEKLLPFLQGAAIVHTQIMNEGEGAKKAPGKKKKKRRGK